MTYFLPGRDGRGPWLGPESSSCGSGSGTASGSPGPKLGPGWTHLGPLGPYWGHNWGATGEICVFGKITNQRPHWVQALGAMGGCPGWKVRVRPAPDLDLYPSASPTWVGPPWALHLGSGRVRSICFVYVCRNMLCVFGGIENQRPPTDSK